MKQLRWTMLRVALAALGLLMVPLVASQVVDGWNWHAGSFVFVYALFFATGMAYALIASKMGVWTYKAGVGLALAAGFALGWGTMVRTSESENPANLWYLSVLFVGAAGAWLTRLKARGMARTLFVMAAWLVAVGALAPRLSAAAIRVPDGLPGITLAVFVGTFMAAGLLFRHACIAEVK